MKKEKDWDLMKTNCQKIITFVSEHPLEGITYSDLSREFNIPWTTIKYLIQSGKCEEVALEFGFKAKIIKRKPNCIEAVRWTIYDTQKERKITQEDNYKKTEE